MNFIEAMQAIREGKKVRRPSWKQEEYFVCDNLNRVINEIGVIQTLHLLEVNAQDWEVAEDNREYLVSAEHARTILRKMCGEYREEYREEILSQLFLEENEVVETRVEEGVRVTRRAFEKAASTFYGIATGSYGYNSGAIESLLHNLKKELGL